MYPPLYSPAHGLPEAGPSPWFLARIMLPFPTVQRARCCALRQPRPFPHTAHLEPPFAPEVIS
ncbi:uncharacterized protein K441DRAFT_650758 [Cenococcum geophilum 1.58]|uniref:uncharacterized protein n=1 Tax=Cenococcum geophilum 1.58 TaxID=794803 RepID=UPI00358EF63E|nr:hypothetical protein K441DRAFT_650758 [Cenococcum geophilum 1.58]